MNGILLYDVLCIYIGQDCMTGQARMMRGMQWKGN